VIHSDSHWYSCDTAGCDAESPVSTNQFVARREAERCGWQIRVKLNGEIARSGGKDYCPDHRRGEAGR
jgi:hypothetical protein